MDSVMVAAAEYLIYAMIIGFGLVWLLTENRRGKVELALASVIAVLVVLVAIKVSASLYYDPRPLVAIADGGDGVTPLFAHDADNGFPSDHSSLAGLMAALVLLRRRWIAGIWFAVGAVAVAWARVAAGVHHLLDVAVGLGLGVVAAAIGLAGMTLLLAKTPIVRVKPLGRWLAADPALDMTARHRPPHTDSPAADA